MPFNYKRYQRCSFTQQQIRDNISYASYQEREQLLAAAKAGKEEFINTAIKLNSRHYDEHHNILLKIFRNEWPEYVLKYRARLQREGLISAVERMMECGNPEHGFAYYECPKCGRYELVTFTCKSRFCPKCGEECFVLKSIYKEKFPLGRPPCKRNDRECKSKFLENEKTSAEAEDRNSYLASQS